MSDPTSVHDYIARQQSLGWRRSAFLWLLRLVVRCLIKFEVTGSEHIPLTGPTIVMVNHISTIDPGLAMAAVTGRQLVPMSKIENFKGVLWPFLTWYGVYAVHRGEVDREALNNSIALLKAGMAILIAPEGTRSPHGLIEAKDGMTYIATKADAIILPTANCGAQHFSENFRRFRRTPVHINFGPAFRFKVDGRLRIPRDELAQMTREAMYQLALAQPDPTLRGVYSDLSQATTETLTFV